MSRSTRDTLKRQDRETQKKQSPETLSRAPALTGPFAGILALQRAIGNRAVTQLLQRDNVGAPPAVNEAPPILQPGMDNADGQPLDPTTRAFMESRFGADFSGVRVHTDGKAAESAQSVNALAYTVGRDVVFGAGQYAPQSSTGQRLIAHELAHIVQQQNTPAVRQGKLGISNPTDSAERSADAVAQAVTTADNHSYRSSALQIRHQLRNSSFAYPTIQRQVNTWGGKYKTDKYELTKDPGWDGVEIELKFEPNKYADAELIGMTQTALSKMKGSPIPFSMYGKDEEKARKSRAIPPGEAAEGTFIDRISSYGNPLYATDKPSAGDVLSSTATRAFWGHHGWHYTDKAGKPKTEDALLKDRPQMPSGLKESSQVFETAALAVKGVQEGTFYGSVQWGWEKDAAGKVTKLPLTLVSNDVPSAVFARASELWNKAKTSEGKETIDLPLVTGKYTKNTNVWLVSNPSNYKTTKIGELEKNTRLEVTNKGAAEPFNKIAAKDQWWKVTVVDGTHIGKVGWVMQAAISDSKTK